MNQEKIGKFIAECRKNQNLTQENLASFLGVSNRTISKWENGKCMPDYSILSILCDKLNISITELLTGEKVDKNQYQKKLEECIILNMDLLKKKLKKQIKWLVVGIFFLICIIFILFAFLTLYLEISQKKVYLSKEEIKTTICEQGKKIYLQIESINDEPILLEGNLKDDNYSYKVYHTLDKKYMKDVSSSTGIIEFNSKISSISVFDEIVYKNGADLEECSFGN